MAREIGSWLSGPEPVKPDDEAGWPGQELGLPEAGPRSLARMGRRFLALLIDWLIAVGITSLAVPLGLMSSDQFLYSVDSRNIALLIWFVLGVLSLRLYGFTPGQYALGLMVIPVDNRQHVGTGRAIVRGLLLSLVIPPLFTDADGRGLQDRLTATAVVRR
ncbi:RDD family protein [Mycobacterium sp. shizuoka-1]|uniref:RDD family protein n=1 Tax=Mycobacterium sp. shizuoka-1 TaxID=2039281 RepID=UPI000C061F22|nr:RDD family protein [Mycobacterium sp. shizuoka-1]GAY15684.1 RDD family protein [Mycobacterium sp. shizuoka-1]